MAIDHGSEPRRRDTSQYLLPGVTLCCFMLLLLRLWYLQVVRGEELSRLAAANRTISVPIPSPRGQVVDRSGRVLAAVKPTLAAMVTPKEIADDAAAIQKLARLLHLPPDDLKEDIQENLYRGYLPFPAKVGLTPEEAVAVEEQRAFLPGVFVRMHSIRSYPRGRAFAHVLGYVSGLDQEDVERLTQADKPLPTFVGKVGVEFSRDFELMGIPGAESIEVDRAGRPLRPRETRAPLPGNKLTLTLDASLQEAAIRALAGKRGAVVAIQPSTGEVLCMVSTPSYDPNWFARKITRAEWNSLANDLRLPMQNRALSSAFAPGSTFKPITLIAAVRAGLVSPGTTFVCTGSIMVGNQRFRCLGHHGRVNYETAVEKSCNVFFYELARRLDRQSIVQVAQQFGLGDRVGIEIRGERRGTLPTDEFVHSRNLQWYRGDTLNLGIGQGYLEVTPLQMAEYACALANRGVAYAPILVKASTPPGNSPPPAPAESPVRLSVDLSQQWWDRVVRAMVRVVDSGSGVRAQISGVRVAGKTGSAEHGADRRPHAWFIGFAPATNPEIAIAVVVEEGGRGGTEAAPVAGDVMKAYFAGRNAASARSR